MKTTSVHELKALIDNGAALELIDVRTPAEYQGVHVPGARLHPLDGLDCAAVIGSRKSANAPLYILCHSGARARKAAERIAAAGCEDCVVVEGGTQAWIDAGFQVNRGASKVLPLAQQLQVAIGGIVLSGVLLGHFVDHNFIWLAGFAGAGLTMAGLTGFCPLRMLLAKMPWNQGKPNSASCSI